MIVYLVCTFIRIPPWLLLTGKFSCLECEIHDFIEVTVHHMVGWLVGLGWLEAAWRFVDFGGRTLSLSHAWIDNYVFFF